MIQLMAIVNLTPDSFFAPSRASAGEALERIRRFREAGASIVDLGAVSTRPGAAPVSARTEWRRLSPVLRQLAESDLLRGRSQGQTGKVPAPNGEGSIIYRGPSPANQPYSNPEAISDGEGPNCEIGPSPLQVSIDTTRAEIVRKAYKVIGPFIVNDISAGEDDPEMLTTVAELGLPFIAMHKRGNPQTMNGLCDYPNGVMAELLRYFGDFAERAEKLGIGDWILDPGMGFAKTNDQCWEILERLEELKVFSRPILIGAADKRFTKAVPDRITAWYSHQNEWPWCCPGITSTPSAPDGTDIAHALSLAHGADILRVHRIA